ncbi:hypothetical protein VDA_002253 [Photobacterium damselae subsp. damselae CIP 102761]|uniref:Uncharacterized protein n=1 Tax=Photobacterium damselae subsp. damselae CIP 102761 TaxID=675817 RepID=D0YY90_PHODD|nr:hypothetical protein VDA_002253 [Photobacterium damselae subsp. damselae CIP 102761]
MGKLFPRNITDKIATLWVITCTPTCEITDNTSRVIGSHHFSAIFIINRTVRNVNPFCLIESIWAAALNHWRANNRDRLGCRNGYRTLVINGFCGD